MSVDPGPLSSMTLMPWPEGVPAPVDLAIVVTIPSGYGAILFFLEEGGTSRFIEDYGDTLFSVVRNVLQSYVARFSVGPDASWEFDLLRAILRAHDAPMGM